MSVTTDPGNDDGPKLSRRGVLALLGALLLPLGLVAGSNSYRPGTGPTPANGTATRTRRDGIANRTPVPRRGYGTGRYGLGAFGA